MRKQDFCLGENKGADQLCSKCKYDQRLCFHYMDSTIPLLLKSKTSCFYPSSEAAQTDLCQTWSETLKFSLVAAQIKTDRLGSKGENAASCRLWSLRSQSSASMQQTGRVFHCKIARGKKVCL